MAWSNSVLPVAVRHIGDDVVVQQAKEVACGLVAVDQRHPRAGDLAFRVVGQSELAFDGGESARSVRAKSRISPSSGADLPLMSWFQIRYSACTGFSGAARSLLNISMRRRIGGFGGSGGENGSMAGEPSQQQQLADTQFQLPRQPADAERPR